MIINRFSNKALYIPKMSTTERRKPLWMNNNTFKALRKKRRIWSKYKNNPTEQLFERCKKST